ncbi:MAG: hypothetical protein JO257_17710 [Deltaproteobacteria bacterium]|nr:hypothetical protein [Deltaproteobacteria bacterium]
MNRKLLLVVLIAACGKKGGGDGAAAVSVTKADADAANAVVPADLKGKIEFEVRKLDDNMSKRHKKTYTFVAPKQWKAGFMPGSVEPNAGDNMGFGTSMQVGTNCDGDCVAKDWAKTADKVNFSQYTSGKVTGKVVKDEKGKNDRLLVFSNEPTVQENAGTATATVNGSAATTTVTVTSGSKGVTVIHAWWNEGDSHYYTCQATLNDAAAALAPAFEKACAKVSFEE